MKSKTPTKPYYWHRKLVKIVEEIELHAYREGLKHARAERDSVPDTEVFPLSLLAMINLIDDTKQWKHKHTPRSRYEKRFGKISLPTKKSVNAYLEMNRIRMAINNKSLAESKDPNR